MSEGVTMEPRSPQIHVLSPELDQDESAASSSSHGHPSVSLSSSPNPVVCGDEDGSYTVFCFWRPRWAQSLLSPVTFLVAICLVIFVDAVTVGVSSGITTSIEIRYRLSASSIGILVTAYSIGTMCALPIVSYFAGRPGARRPRWISAGIVIMSIGTMLSILPQFIFYKYNIPLTNDEVKNTSLLCKKDLQVDQCHNADVRDAQNTIAYWLMAVGYFVLGVGYACVPAPALSYIDDNCKTETTALYTGIMESMYGIGTLVGFFVSSLSLTLWVDFYRVNPSMTLLSQEHPAWVGAWWLGLSCCAVFLLVFSFPILGFPMRLPKRFAENESGRVRGKNESDESVLKKQKDLIEPDPGDDGEAKTDCVIAAEDGPATGFMKTCSRLLRNPVFMFISLAMMAEAAVSFGFGTFFVKYLESQFEVTASTADLLTGVALVPPYGVGWILGGVIVRKTKMSNIGMVIFTIGSISVALGCFVLLFFLGCSNARIAGVNFEPTGQSLSDVSLVFPCNHNCGCTTASYQPVCDEINDVTYLSPCHAGCNATIDNMSYHNCSCLAEGVDSIMAGLCEFECKMLVPFIIVQIIQTMALTMAGVPQVILLLRFVNPTDKTSALGMNHLLRSLGGLVGPLVYGVFVDVSCVVWQSACDSQGSCLVYDIDRFRNLFMGVSLAIGALGSACIVPIYIHIRKVIRESPGKEIPLQDTKN